MATSYQPTPAQTIGPFFGNGLGWLGETAPTRSALLVNGRVLDGAGEPVGDAMIEAWMPAHEAGIVSGIQRVASDAEGRFRLHFPPPEPGQPAAYITLFARGLLEQRFTAVWIEGLGSGDLWEQTPVSRRGTLQARALSEGQYAWNIVMQGTEETVFFDYQQ